MCRSSSDAFATQERNAFVASERLAIVAAAAVLAGATTTRASSPELAAALGHALAAPDIDPRRTAALAVDLQTGNVVFCSNCDALRPASAEKLAVSFAALRLLGPSFGSVRRWSAPACSTGRSGTATSCSSGSVIRHSASRTSKRSRETSPPGASGM